MSLAIRRITIAVLAALLVGAVLAVPASSKIGPSAVASKKAKSCKKGKKGKRAKKKRCKRSGGSTSGGGGIPGQATPSSPTQPAGPPTAPTVHVDSLGVAASTVLAPNSTTGTVTLDVAAPSGGQQVDLQSDSARVTVPSFVLVAPGQKNASFSVDTSSGPAVTATLTASIDASNASTQVHVVNAPSVSSVKLARQCFTFGPFSSNRVTLDVPAPEDTLVSLLSSDPSALQVPAGVTVPSGSTSAFFSVDALAASGSVTVTASLGSSEATDSAPVSETDPVTHAAGLTLNPDTVVDGDGSTGTVTLDCEAPAGGTTVTLASSDPQVGVPVSVNVPAGQLSAEFPITTQEGMPDGPSDISATAGGDTVHATLSVVGVLPT